MSWEKFDNIRGPQGLKGDPGTIGAADAVTVPHDSPARAILTGTTDVHVLFEIPQGVPGEDGGVGPAGTFDSATAETVAPYVPAEVTIQDIDGQVNAHFKIPRGVPGANEAPTAEAIRDHLAAADSDARVGLESGMAQVAADTGTAFYGVIRDMVDDDLATKADLVDGTVPHAQLGAEVAATAGSVPVRGAAGELQVGEPSGSSDAATKAYVDNEVNRGNFVRGSRLWSYGHSYTKVPSNYTTPNGGEYPLVVGRELNFSDVYGYGRGATPLIDTFSLMLSATWDEGAASRQWPGAAPQAYGSATSGGVNGLNMPRGVVMLQNYMNEAPYESTSTDSFIDYWGKQLRSTLALLSGRTQSPGSSGEVGTGWTSVTGEDAEMYPNSRLRRTSTIGDHMLYKAWGDEVWIVVHASTGGGYVSGKLDVFVGAAGNTLVTTIDPNGIRPAYDSRVRPGANSRSPLAIKVTGLNALAGTTGEKIVRVQAREAVNTFQSVIINPRSTPPKIFVAKEPPKNPGSEGADRFAVTDPKFRAQIDAVCAEFPNVYVVDLAPGWDNNTFVSSFDSANFHPNDLGQRHIASAFRAAIEANITSPQRGVLVI